MSRSPDPLDELRAANPVTTPTPVNWSRIDAQLRVHRELDSATQSRHAHRRGGREGRPVVRRWAPVALGGLASGIGALVVSVMLSAGTSSPAYAVTEQSDGTITVTLSELVGVTGANQELAKLGVKATVTKVEPGCTATVATVPLPAGLGVKLAHPEPGGLTIHPTEIPPGDSLLLTAQQLGAGVGLSVGLYRGPAPSCVPTA